MSRADAENLGAAFPQVDSVMIGRGLIADPGMLTETGTTPRALESFMDELFDRYRVVFGSSRNAMFRLKENWRLILKAHPAPEKLQKKLLKTTDEADFKAITQELYREMQF
jgi:tRNA-dihydrouridine synthase